MRKVVSFNCSDVLIKDLEEWAERMARGSAIMIPEDYWIERYGDEVFIYITGIPLYDENDPVTTLNGVEA